MQIKTPDIGVDKAIVADILVSVGDTVNKDDAIVTVESDKASVDVPSSSAGVVKAILVKQGDEVAEGTALIELEASDASAPVANTTEPKAETKVEAQPAPVEATTVAQPASTPSTTASSTVEVKVPDIGVEKAVLAEILVKIGDTVAVDDSLVVVESDKATVEVPSTVAGEVTAIAIKVGDTVKEGVVLLSVKTTGSTSAPVAEVKTDSPAPTPVAESKAEKTAPASNPAPVAPVTTTSTNADKLTAEQSAANAKVYAGPAVRQLARELGVVLTEVKASNPHGRILKDDVFAYVKTRLNQPGPVAVQQVVAEPAGLPKLPDFSAFGGVEEQVLTRLQQVSIPQLSLNNYIPQVTQFDLADITELEAWRNELKDGFKKQGVSLTILAFIAKAVAHLLLEERYFASHLADDGKSVLLRNEIHMGIAVATPDGLTVPVLRNPDQKTIKQIAQELGELSQKARDKKLSPKDLQGANFTITSLGSIGGTAFTPLVNWPQVAILGISPAKMQPVWDGQGFEPRLMLPLSLSYDHRVINGADAARFTTKLAALLKDIRTVLL